MNPSIRHILALLIPFGSLGLFLLSVADDSFLFLPIGSDLLTVVLIARNHGQFLICVFAAAAGSTVGVFFLDLVCRKGGEAGLKHLMKPAQLRRLGVRMQRHAALALIVACLAPPPFPFGAYIATAAPFNIRGRACSVSSSSLVVLDSSWSVCPQSTSGAASSV